MKNIIKIVIWFILIVMVLLAGLIATSVLLEDKIVNKSVSVINNQLNVPVNVNSIEFSLIKQFPNASLQLNNVLLLSGSKFNTKSFNQPYADTLVYFDELYLSVNLLALLKNKLDITKAYGKQGQVNFLVDKSGNENFKVFEQKVVNATPDKKNDLVFMLNQIQLKQVKVRFINSYKNTGLVLFAPNYTVKGNFYKENYSASSKGKLLLHTFEQGKLKLQPSAPASVLANLAINNNSIQIESGYIQTSAYKLSAKGLVKLGNNVHLDLKLSGSTSKLNELFKDANLNLNKQFNASGKFGISAVIKGIISNTESPAIAANFKIEDAVYSNGSSYKFHKINVAGSFSNGNNKSAESSSINLKSFELYKGSSKIYGNARFSNFNKPFLETSVTTALNLNDLESFLGQDNNVEYMGNVQGQLKVSGYFNTDKDWKYNLKTLQKEGQLVIRETSLKINKPRLLVEEFNADARFDNVYFTLDNVKTRVQSSAISGKISFINYVAPIIDSTQPIKLKSVLKADNFIYTDFESLFEGNKSENSRDYNIYCDFKSDKAGYKNLEFNTVSGELQYVNSSLNVSNIFFNSQGGNVEGNLQYLAMPGNSYRLQTNAKTRNINIKSLFKAFNNFNQEQLKAENINGQLTSDFELEMVFNDGELDTATIEMLGHLRIDNGELNNFKPISEAARFSDIQELKHIQFSKLENDILIANSTIYIPQMQIASNAFDMEIHGKQKFSGDYTYHLKINMSDFLGGKSKRLSKQQSEFGYIEDDGYGKKTLFLVATSINNESKVKLDRTAIKENFKSKRKQEKQEFKQALRNEFGIFKKDTTLKKKPEAEEKQEFIIEWDEE